MIANMADRSPIDSAFLEFVKTDDALFHYTTRSVAIEHVLPTKLLKLSLRASANDPWEYRFMLLNANGSFPPDKEHLYTDVHPHIDRVLRMEHRIASFCTNHRPELILMNGDHVNDEYALLEGWNKPRMWSQYGENHHGACLAFSRAEIEKSIGALALPPGSIDHGFVKYTQRNRMPHRFFTIDAGTLVAQGLETYARTFVRSRARDLFYVKHIDYRDEAEFRVSIHDSTGEHEYLNISKSLKGVVWGDRSSEEDLKEYNLKCSGVDVGCAFARWDRGTSHLLYCTKKGET